MIYFFYLSTDVKLNRKYQYLNKTKYFLFLLQSISSTVKKTIPKDENDVKDQTDCGINEAINYGFSCIKVNTKS